MAASAWLLTGALALAAKTDPLPPSAEARSNLASADSGITDMFVSHSYKATDKRAHPGEDILKYEAEAMRDFREGTGQFAHYKNVPAKNKGLILRRYEEGDEAVTEEFIEAGKSGYRRLLGIFDFNPAMTGTFKDGEKSNTDFDHVTYKESAMAKMMQKLRADPKLKLNDVNHGYVSQPLYNGDMAPIMHNKDMIFIIYNDNGSIKELTLFTGSNNMTNNPRYNRMFRIVDQQAIQYILDNCNEMADVFSKGGAIKEIKSRAPLRLTYADGSTMELAFTDGKFNPNDRIQATLERAAKNPKDLVMKRATLSHFVATDGDVIEGLRAAMTAHPEMTTTAVLDDKFLALNEFGKGSALAGYNTTPKFGKSTRGFAANLRSRITAFGYQKMAQGRVETDPDGPPISRELWHDKTTVLEYSEGGVDWVEVYTGSFNLSTNGANAELQIKFRVPAKSYFGQMILESITKVAENEPEFAIKLETAVFRNFLGDLIGHSIAEIPVEKTESVIKAFRASKYDAAMDELRELGKQPTTLRKKFSAAELEARLEKVSKFLEWAAKHSEPTAPKGISPQRFTAGTFGVVNPEASPGRMIQSMRSALWDAATSKDELEKKARDAMTELGQKLPTPKEEQDADPKDGDGKFAREGRPDAPGGKPPVKRKPRSSKNEECEAPLVDPGFAPGNNSQ
ncbi:MAG: hypothetical protein HY074_16020 [Deltaproteobacteria bacterium]|nr:hypothetical protein [Deltaproteobacteria bacterium]